jgi:hypothetical protein
VIVTAGLHLLSVVSGLSCGGVNVCTVVDLHLWLVGDENGGCSGVVSAKLDQQE